MNNNNFQFNINPQNVEPQPLSSQPINNQIPNPINDAINLGNIQTGNQVQNNPINTETPIQNEQVINIPPTPIENNPNNFINPNNQINNPNFSETLQSDGINLENNSKFINNSQFNETTINDLNVDGAYNNMNAPDYIQDPKVMENLNKVKKTTVQLPADSKTFIIIAIVLFIFILIMPYIFDLIRNIKY